MLRSTAALLVRAASSSCAVGARSVHVSACVAARPTQLSDAERSSALEALAPKGWELVWKGRSCAAASATFALRVWVLIC